MSIKVIEHKNDELYLEFENIDSSLVNAIRRTILSDCETVAFNTDEYLNSDLKILKNTSSLHNEFILHRVGLIPINIKDIINFYSSKYKFILNKSNTTNNIISVTTEDFKIINTETNKEEPSIHFFPPNNITKEYIQILKLKPNPNSKGEEIHIEGKASKSSGSKNARFSPVSCIYYKNKMDKEKIQKALKEFLKTKKTLEKKEIEKISKRFIIEEGERHFYTDENDEPNIFEFYIESVGVVSPELILIESIVILINKLTKLKNNINKIVNENVSLDNISIQTSLETMQAYTITIQNESHTLGNLLQSYISKVNNDTINFVGYKNPHPLKNMIEIKLSPKIYSLEETNNIFTNTCDHLIDILQKYKEYIYKYFKLKQPITIKKKLSKKVKESDD